jgi:ABC-type antimicrobial peptide transport system permease subunit
MSQTPHSENGLEKNSSEQKPPNEDIGDIGSKTNPNSQTHHKMNNHQTISSTQESVLKNNQEISKNNQNFQTTHSSQTLEAELIAIEKLLLR